MSVLSPNRAVGPWTDQPFGFLASDLKNRVIRAVYGVGARNKLVNTHKALNTVLAEL